MKAKDYLKFIIPIITIVLVLSLVVVSFSWYSASSSVSASGTATAAGVTSVSISFANTSTGANATYTSNGTSDSLWGDTDNYLVTNTYFLEDTGREYYCGETMVDEFGAVIPAYTTTVGETITKNYDYKYTLYMVLGIASSEDVTLNLDLDGVKVYRKGLTNVEGAQYGYTVTGGVNSFYNPNGVLNTAVETATEFDFKIYAYDAATVLGTTYTNAADDTAKIAAVANAVNTANAAVGTAGGFGSFGATTAYTDTSFPVATDGLTWVVLAIRYGGDNSEVNGQPFAYSGIEWMGSFFKFEFKASVT